MTTSTSGRVQRIGWGLADQAVSSLTNMIGLALIGRWLDPESFGVVALLFTLIPVGIVVARGTWGEALLVLSEVRGRRDPRRSPVALGGALATGVALGALTLVAAALIPAHGTTVAVAGLWAPLLLLHDTGRYVRFGEGRPFLAFASDLTWLAVSVVGLVAVEAAGGGATLLLAAWFAGLVPATVIVLIGVRPAIRGVSTWLREDRPTWGPLLGDVAGSAGFRALALVVVIAASGLEDGGGFRAAQVTMGPVTIMTLAAAPMFLYGAPARSAPQVRSAVAGTSVVLAVAASSWLGLVLLAPSRLGESALGAAWVSAEPLIGAVGLYHVAAAAALAPFLGLRSLQRTGTAFLLRIGSGAALVIAAGLGAAHGGARSAALGMAGVEFATLVASFGALGRVRGDAAPGPDSRSPVER
ncbi:MATE family efflux transporter [Actinomarinicola tropica]|uniref:Oligosaccharide flippase family protein n=1 Tax=Actinomarinicola tropica TaxID=2789776 RepID=A0A5Q2RN04_9ACTN|nr:hypothetical protein [Actinomarinicola tropica]QGG95467.1 hypothetical protein GH723_10355 [Actinomarinicola tropica]